MGDRAAYNAGSACGHTTMIRLTHALILLLALAPGQGTAAHITDKLVVALYPAPEAEGPPLQLLSSGTPLEVLDRRSGFAQVRLGDDTTGWVEASYVTEEKPAKAMLLETQAKLRQMGLELAKLRSESTGEGGQGSAPAAGVSADLHAARERIAELEAALDDTRMEGQAQEQLAVVNDEVRIALDRLAATQGLTLAPGSGPRDVESDDQGWSTLMPWVVAIGMLLLGFAGGIAFIDHRIRRRHGGFRI